MLNSELHDQYEVKPFLITLLISHIWFILQSCKGNRVWILHYQDWMCQPLPEVLSIFTIAYSMKKSIIQRNKSENEKLFNQNLPEVSSSCAARRAIICKLQRKKSRQSSTDNSLSSRRSYSRNDNGPDASDVIQDMPLQHLQDLMLSFYKTKVVVNTHNEQNKYNYNTCHATSYDGMDLEAERWTSSMTS